MLFDKTISRAAVVSAFMDVIQEQCIAYYSAYERVRLDLAEIACDMRDNGLDPAEVYILLEWWDDFGNLSLRLLGAVRRFGINADLLSGLDLEKAAELAQEYEERWHNEWPEGEGFGSSDFNAWMANYMRDLGYKVEIVSGHYAVNGRVSA